MDVKQQLLDMLDRHQPDLGVYAWVHETDRWAELIFCLLLQCTRQEAAVVREAVAILKGLDLLDVGALSVLEDAGGKDKQVLIYALERYGFSNEEIQNAVLILTGAAQAVKRDYGTKIQRCLRQHANAVRTELAQAFRDVPLAADQMNYALSHWLQNAFGLPVSLQNQAVVEYCKENGILPEDLMAAADEMNLNVALLDDLLEMEQQSKSPAVEFEPREKA